MTARYVARSRSTTSIWCWRLAIDLPRRVLFSSGSGQRASCASTSSRASRWTTTSSKKSIPGTTSTSGSSGSVRSVHQRNGSPKRSEHSTQQRPITTRTAKSRGRFPRPCSPRCCGPSRALRLITITCRLRRASVGFGGKAPHCACTPGAAVYLYSVRKSSETTVGPKKPGRVDCDASRNSETDAVSTS